MNMVDDKYLMLIFQCLYPMTLESIKSGTTPYVVNEFGKFTIWLDNIIIQEFNGKRVTWDVSGRRWYEETRKR